MANEGKYFEAVGRRKTSIARVRIFVAKNGIFNVNQTALNTYFSALELQKIVRAPLDKVKLDNIFNVEARVKGGGLHSQAEAVRHGLSRALLKYDPELRKQLKPLGFLTRDQRAKERRKFGLKKARKAPQWSKR